MSIYLQVDTPYFDFRVIKGGDGGGRQRWISRSGLGGRWEGGSSEWDLWSVRLLFESEGAFGGETQRQRAQGSKAQDEHGAPVQQHSEYYNTYHK